MKLLLRSIFACDPSDDEDLFLRNYFALVDSGLGFEVPEYNNIWGFIQEFVVAHNHVPDHSILKAHFEREAVIDPKLVSTVDQLNHLKTLTPVTRGNFVTRLESKANDRRSRRLVEILKEVQTIATVGLQVKEGKKDTLLKGSQDAVRHFIAAAPDIITPTLGSRLYGEVTADGDDFIKEVDRVMQDPLAGIGQFSGLRQMDDSIKGAKKFELWTHAAFTGHLKSTLAVNWVYNQAVYMGHSSVYFSLEMPYEQVRRIIYTMHSMHEKFNDVRVKLGIQPNPKVPVSLSYQFIRFGNLEPHEYEFLTKHVVPDLKDPKNKYGKMHVEVSDPGKSDFTVNDMKSKAELIYNKSPFGMLVVDHVLLVSPRKWVSSQTDRANEVVRDLKRMAMSFNRGEGMAILALFQISRRGFEAAEKGNGRYNLTHLSYSNEIERSSDVVTASWLDDTLRKSNRVLIQCLKTRDQGAFDPFLARVEWTCRRLLTCNDPVLTHEDKKKMAKQIDEEDYEDIDDLMNV